MPKIFNASIFRRVIERFNLKDGIHFFNHVRPDITPVIEIDRPVCEVTGNGSLGTSASTITLISVPSDKNFYLTAATLGIVKDATNDGATGRISIIFTTGGVQKELISIPYLTLTAQSEMATITLPYPLKCDKGTSVQITAPTFTVGNFLRAGTAIGYLDENL